MKLKEIVNSDNRIYFIPCLLLKNGEIVFFDKSIYTNPATYENEGLIECDKIIDDNNSHCYGLPGSFLLRENIDILIVEIAYEWESSQLKVVYEKESKRVLWENGKWPI